MREKNEKELLQAQHRVEEAQQRNRALEQKQCPARVTHLSHAARGLDEQPTVHEGYVARNLEKQGLVADRCELNREIRADNKLLRELKAALQKLTGAAAYSVERIAQALETIRDKIVLAEYQLTVNSRRARGYRNTAESVRPVLAEIRTVGQQILARTAERKTAQAEKDACGGYRRIKEQAAPIGILPMEWPALLFVQIGSCMGVMLIFSL